MPDNAPEHKTVTKDGYEITFHPAFSSGCRVRDLSDGSERELYKQQERHELKNGQSHPKKHVFRMKGGKHNRDVELEIRDPKHQIARITVELYDETYEPGWGAARESEPVEVVTLDNSVMTCPPYCDGEDPFPKG